MNNKILGINATSYLLIAIIIIASFLRLYNLMPLNNILFPPGLYPDEAMNGNNAQEAIDTGNFKFFYPENFGREGLFINIQSLSIAALGNHPWALRFPSAIFGILTVLGMYFLVKELFGDRHLALLTAFLLATSFWHINFSRIGFRAIMAPFFLTWSIYFLIKSFNVKYFAIFAAIGGLLYGLGFHSYIAYRATPLLILIILAIIYWQNRNVFSKKKMWFIFSIFTAASIITILPLGIYFYENPQDFLGRTAGISIFSSQTPFKDLGLNVLKTAGMFNIFGDFNWRHNISGRPELFWPVGIFFLVGLFFSIKKIIIDKKWASQESIILSWFLISLLPVVVSNEGLPHALRSILAVPAVFIIAAIGGMKIYEILKNLVHERSRGATIIKIAAYLFLSLFIFQAYYSYFITWGENPNVKNSFAYNDYIIAQQFNNIPKETPKYIIVSNAENIIERDNPISLQSILFLTDTFTNEKRAAKNFHYLTTEQAKSEEIPSDSFVISLY